MILNDSTHGKVWYGLHMLPGIAQYGASGEHNPQRIFINEDTIRKMDATFAGKPVFVDHIEEVTKQLDDLRKQADGWVVESFYNAVDGKHWVKFITVTDSAERAIKNGFRLSNAYVPVLNGKPGVWNAVPYQNEVVNGEYEHLAIVKDPRYEESVVLTPEQFKQYNEDKQLELRKIANNRKGETSMIGKLKFWTRKPVEADYENLSVVLPKTGKEYTIKALVNTIDAYEEQKQKTPHHMENEEAHHEKRHLEDSKHHSEHKKHSEHHPKHNAVDLEELHREHKELKSKIDHLCSFLEEHHGYENEHKMHNREEDSEVDLELKHDPIDVEGDLKNEDEEESAVIEEHRMEKKADASESRGEHQREQKGSGHDYEEHGRAAAQRQHERDGAEPMEFPKKEFHKKMKNSTPDFFNDLKSAPFTTAKNAFPKVDLGQLSRGKSRYGSGKFN